MVRLASDRTDPWRDRCEILRVDGSLPLPGADGEFDRFIATLLSASRQSVNEALGDLRERGLVETGYRTIRLIDRRALEVVAAP